METSPLSFAVRTRRAAASASWAALLSALFLAIELPAQSSPAPTVSTTTDTTTVVEQDTLDADSTAERLGLWARRTRSSGLILTSGKTYNRVEGLPVQLGPVFRDSVASAAFNVQVLGIIRSADTFHWDSDNLGHLTTADVRDRKSTRLNSSHGYISYAVFCLKKKIK